MGIYDKVIETLEEAEVIEKHMHTGERWFGSTAGSSPGLISSIIPWVITTSATIYTYGDPVELFDGTEGFDYSFISTKFDPHKVLILDTSSDNQIWKFQFASSQWDGEAHTYANMGEALAAGKYSEGVVKIDAFKSNSIATIFQTGRTNVGSKLWCRAMNDEASASTISIILGVHAYLV